MREHIGPDYDKKLLCSLCGNAFTSKKIRSRAIRVEKSESDFYLQYKDSTLNPILYEIYVCPECGFSFNEQFDDRLAAEAKVMFRKKISSNWKKQSYGENRSYEEAAKTYKLALLSAEETEQTAVVKAGLCLRLSWLYRYLENEKEEARFQKHARSFYEASYTEGDFKNKNMTEMTVLYLIGELSRRLGDKEGAARYFSKVIQHIDSGRESSITEKAREQWFKMRRGS